MQSLLWRSFPGRRLLFLALLFEWPLASSSPVLSLPPESGGGTGAGAATAPREPGPSAQVRPPVRLLSTALRSVRDRSSALRLRPVRDAAPSATLLRPPRPTLLRATSSTSQQERMASPPSVNNENYDPKTDKAGKANSNDPGWKYGYWANLQKIDKVTCTLCDTEVSGGIKRLKQHLAGGYGDAKMCPKTTTAIRKEMRDYLESNKRARPLFLDEPADVVEVEAIAAPAAGGESVQVEDTAPAESQASKVQPSSGTAAKQRRANYLFKATTTVNVKEKPKGNKSIVGVKK